MGEAIAETAVIAGSGDLKGRIHYGGTEEAVNCGSAELPNQRTEYKISHFGSSAVAESA